MKQKCSKAWGLGLLAAFLSSSMAHAGLIAEYTFDDGTLTDGLGGLYNLSSVGSAPDLTSGAYASDGSSSNFLQVEGPGGMRDWTLSLWAYTDTPSQGSFEALFSNNTNPRTRYSWQIDSDDGDYRLLSRENGNNAVTIGAASSSNWQHIVVQKFNNSGVNLFLDGALVSTEAFNPGGLQNFRVGVNRNGDRSFEGFIDNIQIWDDSQQNAAAIAELFQAGPGANSVGVPGPAPAFLLASGLLALRMVRRPKG